MKSYRLTPDDFLDISIEHLAEILGRSLILIDIHTGNECIELSDEELDMFKRDIIERELSLDSNIRISDASRTAIKCKMKEYIDFAHEIIDGGPMEERYGGPIDNDYIKNNIDDICLLYALSFLD